MEIADFHEIIASKSMLDILANIEEENVFYFKSKNNPYEFLAYGAVSKIDQIDFNKSIRPVFYCGNFEDEANLYHIENYILRNDNEYNININRAPGWNETEPLSSKATIKELTNFKEWEINIQKIKDIISDKVFKKIVLSRDVELRFDQMSPRSFIKNVLQSKFNNQNYAIYYKMKATGFISVTPEMFASETNRTLKVLSLAGSTPINDSAEENANNELLLLNNQKLIDEHEIVTNEVCHRMNQICNEVEVSNLKIMKLKYVQHRECTLTGRLKENINILDIIEKLHPTPAVGTMPYSNGITTINQIEGRKRNSYAAPIGIITKNFLDLAVGLRSGTFNENTLTLHTGCGVIEGSDAEAEWDETKNKLAPFKKVMSDI